VRLRATDRSPGPDPLAVWRTAARLGLPVSCVGRWPDLTSPAFAELLHALPELVVVLEHLGAGPEPDRDDEARAGRHAVFGLARFPGVHLKVPGLGEFSARRVGDGDDPFVRPVPDLLGRAYECFGAARLMWASDFPPVATREGYGNALRLCRAEFAHLPADDQHLIFGGTAQAVFGRAVRR
jgi:L-fuconolactonase